MVRDGNIYDSKKDQKIYPKDYGTVRATKAFDYSANQPKWYLWQP